MRSRIRHASGTGGRRGSTPGIVADEKREARWASRRVSLVGAEGLEPTTSTV
jgi:hypothetical protein